VGFAAEHGGDTLRAKLLGDWEEIVVQVPAAVNQRLVAGKPEGQLDSNPALAAATTGPSTSATCARNRPGAAGWQCPPCPSWQLGRDL
jgi:hypothetical protein